MASLYLVATPIGNLEDISARALRILREVEMIAAEDTRHTRKLLNHFNIKTRLVSYHDHNKGVQTEQVLAALEEGDIALVSDAGTPALNDPGYELVRAALNAGHQVSPIPGACAPVAALVASGLPTDAFVYLGYLPRKQNQRRQALALAADLAYTLIFLETPHRIVESLIVMEEVLGDRQIAVARELTKLYEEVFRGAISQARDHFAGQKPRGEITLVVAGKDSAAERWDENQVRQAIIEAIPSGEHPGSLASRIASEAGWARRHVYGLIVELQKP